MRISYLLDPRIREDDLFRVSLGKLVASGAAITRSIASDGCPVRLPSKLIGELRPSAE